MKTNLARVMFPWITVSNDCDRRKELFLLVEFSMSVNVIPEFCRYYPVGNERLQVFVNMLSKRFVQTKKRKNVWRQYT